MDYLTRLIAGAGTSPTKQRPNTPAERLNTCTKICHALQHLWRNSSIGPEDASSLKRAIDLLCRLNNILYDESRKAAPHSCLLHVASSQIYIIIVKLALSSQDSEVTQAAAQIFHVLINGEAEGLLDNRLFSRSLLDLVRYTVVIPRVVVDERTEADLIELLFEIATKIRLDPDILPAWFHPERERSQARNAQGETRRNQFPLFYVLVQYVHHDGPVGDFARTGLLYLTETASKSKPLETWMIESDLAPQMASGLGALYSRLSRRFPALDEKDKALPILALSDLPQTGGGSSETREDFRQDMRSFLSYLAFWQDTLNHCTSSEVKDTLLDHFQVLFVQQLLYPSLLESSDVDGGSTAAVISHLARMLIAMDNAQLAQRMLPYLLASKTSAPRHRPRLSISRRKSIDQLASLAEAAQSPSPNLFNLLDLIIMSLKSKQVTTVYTCLKLLSVIFGKHHSSVLTGLFRTEIADSAVLDHSVKTFNNTLIKLFDLAAATAQVETMDDSYQATLTDTKFALERHSCSLHSARDENLHSITQMTIAGDCKLLDPLLAILGTFFANDTLVNLQLTEVLLSVAACEHISLQGWLLPVAETNSGDTSQNVMYVLQTLAERVRQWHSQYPEWDKLIAIQRQSLTEDDGTIIVSDVGSVSGQRKLSDAESGTRSGSSSRQNSRPATPRGRPISGEFGSIDGALSASPKPRSSLYQRTVAVSPLRQTYIPEAEPDVESLRSPSPGLSSSPKAALDTRVRLFLDKTDTELSPLSLVAGRLQSEHTTSVGNTGSAVSEANSGAATPSLQDEDQHIRTHASLGHILTNAIILQEFILEVAAVVQIRGTLFAEVDLH